MPSPFPGMDPYLERPDRWSGVHTRLIAVIGEMLARQVAPRFFVDSEDNVYILGLDDPAHSLVRPDLSVVEAVSAGIPAAAHGRIAAPVILDLPAPVEIRAPYLKVIDTVDRRVVTTIEVLSPVNKVSGSSGQRDFLRKRGHILNSSTHWLEIDLLRAGTRPPGIPSRGDYDAALHRAGSLNRLDAWFVSLREPLPTVAVPLQPPFEDVPLDLQEVVGQVYDRYRYDTGIAYTEEPPAPLLREADVAWARERVTAWRQGRAG
ncbi:MAG: DUF4058 family protein [Chloroflexota bacterium]|nr:DUF4058 family protein [Chloroflexota bacterium]